MTEHQPIPEAFLACLRRDPAITGTLSAMPHDQWDRLLRIAEDHGLTPVLYHRLTRKFPGVSIPEEIGRKLKADYLSSAARNTLLFADVTRLISALGEHSTPVIVLKGAYLGPLVYGNIALRPMSDVDLLVRRGDLAKVQDLLLREGYRPTAHVAIEESPAVFQELPVFINDRGLTIDLHWHLVDPRGSLAVGIDGIWDRAVPFSLDGKDALCLSPEDLLAYLCIHLAVNHAFDGGIRGLLDVHETVRHFADSLDWQLLEARATEWGALRSVRIVLSLTEKWFGTRIPVTLTLSAEPDSGCEEMIRMAESLLFSTEGYVQDNVARLADAPTIVGKARYLVSRVFISRTELATFYPVPKTSPRIYFCYIRRLVDLLWRHGSTLPKLMPLHGKVSPELTKGLERNRLRDWLLKES